MRRERSGDEGARGIFFTLAGSLFAGYLILSNLVPRVSAFIEAEKRDPGNEVEFYEDTCPIRN